MTRFINDDEFIIILNDQNGGSYGVDDLHRLYDAGIRTIIRYPFWRNIETAWGVYDWESVDRWIDEDRQAGLKTMLAIYDHPPAFLPDEWYLRRPDGELYTYPGFYERVMSPWNFEGWRYHLNFIARCCQRNNAPDVLCFRSTVQGGAVMLPEYEEIRLDGELLPTVLRMMSDEQGIFVTHPSHEIWTALHPALDSVVQSGNALRGDIYNLIRREFPQAIHHVICHVYFADVLGKETTLNEIRQGVKMWVGSEYAEGLTLNTDEAISLGFRGFVTSPLHTLGKYRTLEPWMLDNIRESLEKWRKARHV
jgi:hypothetical protein